MVVFCSDLDNTLIYSYKHEIGDDRQCVEVYQDREVSFMTERSVELLRQVNGGLCFVPVTTRTMEQYRRIRLSVGEPSYALVCNGGILLVNGGIDREWYEESLRMAEDSRTEIEKAAGFLEQEEDRCFEVRNIQELFLFTKSGQPLKTVERLKEVLDLSRVDVFSNGMKVYVVPVRLNKGDAVRRLKKRLGACFVIAAGDSEFDIPMLREADLAFLPGMLSEALAIEKHMVVCKELSVFSDEMLEKIMERMQENR